MECFPLEQNRMHHTNGAILIPRRTGVLGGGRTPTAGTRRCLDGFRSFLNIYQEFTTVITSVLNRTSVTSNRSLMVDRTEHLKTQRCSVLGEKHFIPPRWLPGSIRASQTRETKGGGCWPWGVLDFITCLGNERPIVPGAWRGMERKGSRVIR